MKLNFIVTLILLVSSFSSFAVLADTDGERDALTKLIHELEALEPLVEEAESQADPSARPYHRFDLLRYDIHKVRSGIEEMLLPARIQPRSFPPLKGDYRR